MRRLIAWGIVGYIMFRLFHSTPENPKTPIDNIMEFHKDVVESPVAQFMLLQVKELTKRLMGIPTTPESEQETLAFRERLQAGNLRPNDLLGPPELVMTAPIPPAPR